MKKIAAALLLSTVAASAFAADEGFYAGVTVGSSKSKAPATVGVLTKNTDTPYGVVGGYQFNKNWAAEVGFSGAGKFNSATASGKADALSLAAVGTLPLNDSFSLYGKLGFARVSGKASGTDANGGTLGNANRTSATYGVGVQYNATQNIGVRFGWDRYGAAVNSTANGNQNYNVDVYGVAAVFKF